MSTENETVASEEPAVASAAGQQAEAQPAAIDTDAQAVEQPQARPPIKVELRQLVGKFMDKGIERRKAWPLDEILLNGKEVAQAAHSKGAPVNVLRAVQLTQREQDAIADAITRKRGTPPAKFNFPPNIDLSKVLDDDEDGDSDEYEYPYE